MPPFAIPESLWVAGTSWSGHADAFVIMTVLFKHVFTAAYVEELTRAVQQQPHTSTQAVKAPLHPCQALNPAPDAADMGDRRMQLCCFHMCVGAEM